MTEMGETPPRILLLAGEPSGDAHAARVARSLRSRFPGCTIVGTGGPAMAAEGVELLAELDDLAVMGFVEVAARFPFFWRLERRVGRLLREHAVDLVIPVDYPGFNLRMTEAAHAARIPVLYYIAPQVWAWKPGRAARLARRASRIAVILPFEREIFEREGGAATFVGHPLLDREDEVPDRETFCAGAGLDPGEDILAIFPGSRTQEIERHLSPFLAAATLLAEERPGLQTVVARAGALTLSGRDLPGRPVIVDDGRALLRHARAALVKSGTTTLEAALEGVPFVVAYRTHPWTFALARRMVRVEHIALANLVAGSRVVPEILQDAVSPRGLADAVRPLLQDSEARRRILEGLERVRTRLGTPGAAERVANLAADILAEGRARAGGGGP